MRAERLNRPLNPSCRELQGEDTNQTQASTAAVATPRATRSTKTHSPHCQQTSRGRATGVTEHENTQPPLSTNQPWQSHGRHGARKHTASIVNKPAAAHPRTTRSTEAHSLRYQQTGRRKGSGRTTTHLRRPTCVGRTVADDAAQRDPYCGARLPPHAP